MQIAKPLITGADPLQRASICAALLLRRVYPPGMGWLLPPYKMPREGRKPLGTRLVQTSLHLALSSASEGENT